MASGDQLAVFLPDAYEPPDSNPAVPSSIAAATGRRPVLLFDTDTDETAIWTGVMPANYAGGGVTVEIHYCMVSATSGAVQWEGAFERVEDNVALGSGGNDFAAVNASGSITVPGTAELVDVNSGLTFSNGADMDSVVAGDQFRFKLNRDVGVASDAAGDAALVVVVLKET